MVKYEFYINFLKSVDEQTMGFDEVYEKYIGTYGTYQKFITSLIVSIQIFVSVSVVEMAFLTTSPGEHYGPI